MAREQLGGILRYLRRTFTRPGEPLSDRQLLGRFAQQRDEDAFATLVERHGPMVLAVCRRVLGNDHAAEDAFQATFVVLARKAASPGWQNSVGSWLYEVAFRCAAKARVSAARRRHHEGQAPDMNPPDPSADVDRRELRSVLDEELTRLPEKYRAPVVLCYLEGKTNEEAARLLGWPLGTVYGRLTRARDLLRGRLRRRNLTLPAAALAAALTESAAPASVPAALLSSTVKAAAMPAAGALAAPVATLAEGVLRAMFLSKLKTAAVLLLGLLVLSVGAGVYHTQRAQGEAAFVPDREEAPKPVARPVPSEPVVKEGLSLTLQADEVVFPAEKPLSFTLTFKNESKEPFLLFDLEWPWDYQFQFYQGDSAEMGAWVAETRKLWERRAPTPEDSILIEPGKSRALKLKLDHVLYQWRGEQLAKPVALDHLAPGKYQVQVTRRFAQSPLLYDFKTKHWKGEITSKPVAVEIKDDRLRSEAERVNGVDFQVVADKVWRIPSEGKTEEIDIGLLITNPGEKALTFNLFDTLSLQLVPTDGREGPSWGSLRERTSPPPPISIAAGKNATVSRKGTLSWKPDSKMLRLQGGDGAGGNWYFDGLTPGKYLLTVRYKNKIPDDGEWGGEVRTKAVEVEVVAPRAERPMTKEKAVELAQAAAEKALDDSWAAVKTKGEAPWKEHKGPWIAATARPEVTERGDGWRIGWLQPAPIAGFEFDVTVDVGKEGKVTVVKARTGFSPR